MPSSHVTRGRLGITAELLEDMPDKRIAAVLNRYCNGRHHDERVFTLVIAEMERRDRLFTEQDQARVRVLQAQADQQEREQRRRAHNDQVREEYRLYVEAAYAAAEAATRGHLLNRRGIACRVHPRVLFSGPARRAYAYASEELRAWWDEHGRMPFTEYQRQSRQQNPAA